MLALPSQLLLLALLSFHSLGHRQATQDDDASERGIGLTGVTETSSSAYGRRHALVIGIDEYQDAAYPDLGYAVADARAVAKILIDRYGFDSDDVRLIVNEDATRDTLASALEVWACDMERVGEEDLFVVFFAGHGVTRPGRRESRGYIVPVDGRSNSRGESDWSSLIGMNDVEDISELVPAKHALFILDCCFGGLAVTRAAPPIAAGLSNRARQVITAGNAQQAVLDAGGGGHSVFTGALLGGLEGDADLDGDQVITFGELFNHVGREVERRTEKRQTPLQATFPDHEGGNVALFSPGVRPRTMTAAQRLKALERSQAEQFAELNRLSDYILIQDLQAEAGELWPQEPAMLPRYRDWLVRAKELLERLPQHEASVRQVRQEAYLSLVVAGIVEEGEGTEPVWDHTDAKLRWRYETFTALVGGLGALELLVADVTSRLTVASTVWQHSIGDYEKEWAEVCSAVSQDELYERLALAPQLGLIPLGQDLKSGLWEFAHLLSGTIPERDSGSGKLAISEETALVFVLVPPGTFMMGAQAEDKPWAEPDEYPAHEVKLNAYFLSKYEMTQGQWSRAAGANPSLRGPHDWTRSWSRGGEWASLLHPVENVSWITCERTLRRLGLVLPTEAQWEYAARGWTTTPWWNGAEIRSVQEVANVGDAYSKAHGGLASRVYESWDDGYTVHAPVGTFLENPMGLFDVHGNVWEWCRDWYGAFSLPVRPGDGERLVTGARAKVNRGGSFDDHAGYARCADRLNDPPELTASDLGLRPARVITD